MATNPAGLPWLLRTWRSEVAELSQQAAAEHLSIAKSTLSQWESAKRHARRPVDIQQLHAVDACFGAGGALVDMSLALRTPAGLPPRRTWAHNFQGPSGFVWAWLRPQPGVRGIKARLLWGAFALDLVERCDDRGLFVTCPVSMPNPAVWVHLLAPGWVDFGRAVIPEQLGVPVIDCLANAGIGTGGHTAAGLVGEDAVARFEQDPEWAEAVLDFFGRRDDLIRQVFRFKDAGEAVVDLTSAPVRPATECRGFTGKDYRRLREARGLSLADAAQLATDLQPYEPITDDQIRVLESGGSPRSLRVRSRLDSVYRADGQTCVEPVRTRGLRSPFTVEFPQYWVGPVWVTFMSGVDTGAETSLRWGEGRKRMLVRPGVTVTCRRPTTNEEPLRVHCPAAWKVTAGVGAVAHASDVNWGWRTPDDLQPPRDDGGREIHQVFLQLFDRTREDFARLFRDEPPAKGQHQGPD